MPIFIGILPLFGIFGEVFLQAPTGIATTRSDTRKITREHIAPAVVADFRIQLPPAKS